MKINIDKNIRLYETAYGDGYPLEIIYQVHFNTIPSVFESETKYDSTIIDYFTGMKKSFKMIGRSEFFSEKRPSSSKLQIILYDDDLGFFLAIVTEEKNKKKYSTLKFVYNGEKHTITDIFNFNSIKKYKQKTNTANIGLLTSNQGYLETTEYDVIIPDINLELNYGVDFLPVHKKILKKLNGQNEKGIVILHGDPGSGKSTYIKYLSRVIKDKEVLYIPPAMAGALSEPKIIPFLMDKPNSILIIEDGEDVLSKREKNKPSAGVSNILNITDGILGDCLKIQIIATFNMEKNQIDEALLRKGRLIAEHQFKKLSVTNTNKLLQHIGSSFKSEKELTLADIYNIDEKEIRVQPTHQKIGFK